MQTETIGRDYLTLALRIERHVEGFVDGYFGPPEIKAAVEAEPLREIAALRDDVAQLQARVAESEMNAQRRHFLTKQLHAMATVLQRQAGETLAYRDEVAGCFDIHPQPIPEAEFEAGLEALNALLPGEGALLPRLTEWKRQFELPKERILPVMETALAEVRRRTLSLLTLPEGEAVTVALVSDQPWSGYNWYLGAYRSRIDINTDLPVRANTILGLIAHEAYPGHHTEHVIKEQRWYHEEGRLEHGVLLLLAPESCIAEAIATVALDVIFLETEEKRAWYREVLYPLAGIEVDVDVQLALEEAQEKLGGVSGNAAFLLHEEGRPEAEVVAYLCRYGLRTEKEARQSLRFISHPLFRPYIFNYFYGRRLLKRAFAVAEKQAVFRWVVSEPVTASSIVARYGLD